ncbi:MAG: UDP-N-acetylmuramoyl-L-alanine--D-glutamate ligase [Gammaproteobacteria bacterium]|nr:UDP-N-acetylmuramoyl-L-alanine--D-glutamate ligase [Gammaproteobacteria bacterium]
MVVDKQRILIVGLGKTGLSCARYLSAQGIEVAVIDSRENPPELKQLQQELPGVAVFTGGFDQKVFDSADELIVSPGISLKNPVIESAVLQGKKILGDVELFAQQAKAPVMVVTGSNGKTTVTSLLNVMAREAGKDIRVGGNIGKPVLELLEDSEPALYLLELSSFQLEYTSSLNAFVSTVLNISEDHMDRYSGVNDYMQAKKRVFRGDGMMVLNRDDAQVMMMKEPMRKIISFGLQEPEENQYGIRNINNECWLCRGNETLLKASSLKIPGLHNISNTLAAFAMGEVAGFPLADMRRAAEGFQGLAHRTQFIKEIDNVRWFNDSKGTNVGATVAALKGMPGKVVLIAGGESKGADFSELKLVVNKKARAVVLIGKDAKLIEQALTGDVTILHASDMQDAVNMAREQARPGDDVILSPACASFDMYENYEQRGNVFSEIVRRLA